MGESGVMTTDGRSQLRHLQPADLNQSMNSDWFKHSSDWQIGSPTHNWFHATSLSHPWLSCGKSVRYKKQWKYFKVYRRIYKHLFLPRPTPPQQGPTTSGYSSARTLPLQLVDVFTHDALLYKQPGWLYPSEPPLWAGSGHWQARENHAQLCCTRAWTENGLHQAAILKDLVENTEEEACPGSRVL